MRSKKIFLSGLIIGICLILMASAVILAGCAKKDKVYHVGILSGLDAFAGAADDFKAKMTELGYIEGKNIIYDFQKVNADPAKYQEVAQRFIDEKVDCIVVISTEATVVVKNVTKGTGIPIVFTNAIIEGSDIVDNIRQPGGDITGVLFAASETTLKRLEILHEMAPQAKRIYMTYDRNYPGINVVTSRLREEALSLNLTLVDVPVTDGEGIKADLKDRSGKKDIGIDAILIMPTLLTAGPDGFIPVNDFAAEHDLPVAGSIDFNTDIGAAFNYFPKASDFGALAAPIVDKILKGTPAGTIPVVTPEPSFRLNYNVTKRLNLTVSDGLLARANEIIR